MAQYRTEELKFRWWWWAYSNLIVKTAFALFSSFLEWYTCYIERIYAKIISPIFHDQTW